MLQPSLHGSRGGGSRGGSDRGRFGGGGAERCESMGVVKFLCTIFSCFLSFQRVFSTTSLGWSCRTVYCMYFTKFWYIYFVVLLLF